MIAALPALSEQLSSVEQCMAAALASREQRVASLIESLGPFHGKLLRPSLCLLVAATLGPVDERHHALGAALELIHTATLVHDDLIDDADTRRGRTTAHVRHGNTTAILLGDFMYTRAFSLVAGLGELELVNRLCAATNTVCEGELHQQMAARDADLSEDEYRRIIYGKTAALTELAAYFGAMAGDDATRRAAAAFGRDLGMAFQIADDCLDVAGDAQKVGKTLATDLERGRVTLPLIRVLAAASAAERPALEHQLLRANGHEQVDAARRLIIERGGVTSSLGTARELIAAAKTHLLRLPDSPARTQLAELADFVVARDF
jgi:octaprenyl-diphosphate synthase